MHFDKIMQVELDALSSSRKAIENKRVYDLMIFSIKGKYVY